MPDKTTKRAPAITGEKAAANAKTANTPFEVQMPLPENMEYVSERRKALLAQKPELIVHVTGRGTPRVYTQSDCAKAEASIVMNKQNYQFSKRFTLVPRVGTNVDGQPVVSSHVFDVCDEQTGEYPFKINLKTGELIGSGQTVKMVSTKLGGSGLPTRQTWMYAFYPVQK